MSGLALVLNGRGKLNEAEPLIRQVLEARRRALGAEHPDTLQAMSGLALVLNGRGKLNEAEPLIRQVLEARRRALGAEHPDTLQAMSGLALVLNGRGKLNEAEPLYSPGRGDPAPRPGRRAPHHADVDECPGFSAPGPGQAGRGRTAPVARSWKPGAAPWVPSTPTRCRR